MEAVDTLENQCNWLLALHITAKLRFGNYLGSKDHIESLPLRHPLL
jgi:hypothetical protein